MSTLAEIENALFALPRAEQESLRRKLDQRLAASAPTEGPRSWPVPPPPVDRAELERIDAEIEAAFPTLRG